jgi:hypothetical protein
VTAAALPPVTVPNLSPRWVTLLRDTKLIAHGEITGGAYASEGLHERNAWLYDALVCILYSESASQPSFSGLPTDEDRFEELAQRVRAYITEANSTYSPKIATRTRTPSCSCFKRLPSISRGMPSGTAVPARAPATPRDRRAYARPSTKSGGRASRSSKEHPDSWRSLVETISCRCYPRHYE